MMNWHDTPIFITNHNNLNRGFRRLVDWLQAAGMTSIAVIDNGSTYLPLWAYYEQSRHLAIMHVGENLGPYAFWTLGLNTKQQQRFIVTDPDVVPTPDCPAYLVSQMHLMLDTFGGKVGPSIRIDNLPDHYHQKAKVIAWEQQFWESPLEQWRAYQADIDTTFALYEPESTVHPGTVLRLAPPYSVEHIPWYEDSAHPTEEHQFYLKHAKAEWIHWS